MAATKGHSSKIHKDLPNKPNKTNWVEQAGGLPSYIERIAKHLHNDSGMSVSHAIASAVNTVKRWAKGGGDVTAATQAKAAKAVAQWNAKRGRARASRGTSNRTYFALELAKEPKKNAKGEELTESGLVYNAKNKTFRAPSESEKNDFEKKHPRAKAGADGGIGGQFIEAGKARDEQGAKAQKSKSAKGNYEKVMKSKDFKGDMSKLNDKDLEDLSQYLYSFKTADKSVVDRRVAIAAELKKRGKDVNDHGGLGKGRKSGAGSSKENDSKKDKPKAPPADHNGAKRTKAFEDGSAKYADGTVWDPEDQKFRKSKIEASRTEVLSEFRARYSDRGTGVQTAGLTDSESDRRHRFAVEVQAERLRRETAVELSRQTVAIERTENALERAKPGSVVHNRMAVRLDEQRNQLQSLEVVVELSRRETTLELGIKKWREWLHPRNDDGEFKSKGSDLPFDQPSKPVKPVPLSGAGKKTSAVDPTVDPSDGLPWDHPSKPIKPTITAGTEDDMRRAFDGSPEAELIAKLETLPDEDKIVGNYSESVDITDKEGYALRRYQMDASSTNRSFREDKEHLRDTRVTWALDSVIAKHLLPETVVVTRGVRGADTLGDNATGKVIEDLGYMSTSFRQLGGWNDFANTPVRMHLVVPKGTPAVTMKSAEDGERAKDEQELLLGRGTQVRISKDETRDGVRYLVGTVIVPPDTGTVELSWKNQPRYPKGHPSGGQWIDAPTAKFSDFKMPSLGSGEKNALKVYGAPHGYKTVNPYLHAGGKVFDTNIMAYADPTPQQVDLAKATIKDLDSAFSKAVPTDKALTVFRRTDDKVFGSDVNDKIGKTFVNKAYTSTAAIPGASSGHGYGYETKNTLWEIHLPQGTKALQGNDFENEVILPRDAEFTVAAVEKMDGGATKVKLVYGPSAPVYKLDDSPGDSKKTDFDNLVKSGAFTPEQAHGMVYGEKAKTGPYTSGAFETDDTSYKPGGTGDKAPSILTPQAGKAKKNSAVNWQKHLDLTVESRDKAKVGGKVWQKMEDRRQAQQALIDHMKANNLETLTKQEFVNQSSAPETKLSWFDDVEKPTTPPTDPQPKSLPKIDDDEGLELDGTAEPSVPYAKGFKTAAPAINWATGEANSTGETQYVFLDEFDDNFVATNTKPTSGKYDKITWNGMIAYNLDADEEASADIQDAFPSVSGGTHTSMDSAAIAATDLAVKHGTAYVYFDPNSSSGPGSPTMYHVSATMPKNTASTNIWYMEADANEVKPPFKTAPSIDTYETPDSAPVVKKQVPFHKTYKQPAAAVKAAHKHSKEHDTDVYTYQDKNGEIVVTTDEITFGVPKNKIHSFTAGGGYEKVGYASIHEGNNQASKIAGAFGQPVYVYKKQGDATATISTVKPTSDTAVGKFLKQDASGMSTSDLGNGPVHTSPAESYTMQNKTPPVSATSTADKIAAARVKVGGSYGAGGDKAVGSDVEFNFKNEETRSIGYEAMHSETRAALEGTPEGKSLEASYVPTYDEIAEHYVTSGADKAATATQQNAVYAYMGSHSSSINHGLRGIFNDIDTASVNRIKAIDGAMANYRTREPMVVNRGVNVSAVPKENMTGKAFQDPAYWSTSPASGFGAQVRMHLFVPAGSHAIPAHGIFPNGGVKSAGGPHGNEKEIMLPRGTTIAVSKDEVDDKGRRHITATVVPIPADTPTANAVKDAPSASTTLQPAAYTEAGMEFLRRNGRTRWAARFARQGEIALSRVGRTWYSSPIETVGKKVTE